MVHISIKKIFIAGTKDFPADHIDDLKLPFDDTLKTLQEEEQQINIIDPITE